ncbi:hypothetical protein [Tropicibacter naphthalenivorans]|uniref:Uncharacterized protein n=1 Tax=Tropicibacter naphthalenivorans TaxID=441103 RepID=A0A0P1GK19_9RHOB|nr:hypothetical protein [Tropicibacter naphthalenivorans]CUH82322.1 hypothetical protein TRN7648_03911 [Tropicibacter naphthalenivorans]SMD05613.1 hypothetical protein SAMN04488093_11325 [Tropicibacter naphthalenivorans]
MSFGRVILGDNQFLGVNHSNQAKAVQLYEQFSKPDAIIEVIGAAYEAGVRDFMFTTHDRFEPVFDEVRRSNLFPGMYYSPCLPYAHKYWSKLSAQSMPSVLKETLFQVNALQVIPAGLGLMLGNFGGFMKLLAEIEVLMCKGLPLRGVFLQNAAFDLLMSIEAHREIEAFAEGVKRRLGAEPGFITMNHPQAVDVLTNKIGLDRPWVCANYNLAGFRMNPKAETVVSSFASGKTRNIAMSVFSSGAAGGQASLRHVVDQCPGGGVDAILFGSSRPENIVANTRTILDNTPPT